MKNQNFFIYSKFVYFREGPVARKAPTVNPEVVKKRKQ
jgi:hypothetical protein